MKNLNLILIICRSIIAEDDQYMPSIGVYLDRSNTPLYFKENSVEIFLSRHYKSNCEEIRKKQIQNLVRCSDYKDQKRSAEIMENIIEECNRIWQNEMQNLAFISDNNQHSMNKRAVNPALIMQGMSLFSGLLPSVTNIFNNIYHFFTSAQLKHEVRDMEVKGSKSNLAFANVGRQLHLDVLTINELVCESESLKNAELLKVHASLLVTKNVESIESEILNLNFATLPRNTDFLKVIFEICLSIKSNNEPFCKYCIYNGEINVRFDGLVATGELLVSLIKLDIPVMSKELLIQNVITVTNIGYFNKTTYNKLSLPEKAIVTSNDFIFELDTSLCFKKACHINAVSQSTRSRCLSSLIENATIGCENIISEPPLCLSKRVPSGHLIACKHDMYFPLSERSLEARRLINETLYTADPGRLLCIDGFKNSTHILSEPIVALRFNSTMVLKETLVINTVIKPIAIENKLSESLKLIESLETIYKNDDHLKFGSKNIDTKLIILLSSLIFPFFYLFWVIINRYKVVLTHYYRHMHTKFRRSKKDITEEGTQEVAQSENLGSNDEAIFLIDRNTEEIYPKLSFNLQEKK